MELSEAMRRDWQSREDELATIREILARPIADRRPWMLYGILGSCAFFAFALVGALRGWSETIVYLLAAACLGALAWGGWRGSIARRQHDRAILAALAELPIPILSRATVSTDFSENERVLVVNFLNRTYPGWTVDFEAADADWQALKNARGRGCGAGCGSGCGSRG